MVPVLLWLSKYRARVLRLIAIIGLIFLVLFIARKLHKPAEIVQVDPVTKIIFVPKEVIKYRDVVKYIPIKDRGVAKDALDAAKNKGVIVDQLGVTHATSDSVGEGTITITTLPLNASTPLAFSPFTFTDNWRLSMTSDGIVDPKTNTVSGTYTLRQKFVITNTIGQDENNLLTNDIKLFELDKEGKELPINTTSSYTIATKKLDTRPKPKLYVKPTLQGGVAVLPDSAQISPNTTTSAFSVSIPWWKRGTARAVETTRYAYLTPTATVNNGEVTVGVSPISFNLGTVKHLPITDLWSSPYIGVSLKNNQKKFGIVFGTTF